MSRYYYIFLTFICFHRIGIKSQIQTLWRLLCKKLAILLLNCAFGTNLPDRIVFCVTFRLKNFLVYPVCPILKNKEKYQAYLPDTLQFSCSCLMHTCGCTKCPYVGTLLSVGRCNGMYCVADKPGTEQSMKTSQAANFLISLCGKQQATPTQ